jgi:hypothetical protein
VGRKCQSKATATIKNNNPKDRETTIGEGGKSDAGTPLQKSGEKVTKARKKNEIFF